LASLTWRDRWRDRLRLAGSVAAIVRNHLTLPRQISTSTPASTTPSGPAAARSRPLRPDELAAHFRELERKLLTRWDAPLINDFLP